MKSSLSPTGVYTICLIWILIVTILYYVNFTLALYVEKSSEIDKLWELGIRLIERIIH